MGCRESLRKRLDWVLAIKGVRVLAVCVLCRWGFEDGVYQKWLQIQWPNTPSRLKRQVLCLMS